MSFSSLLFPKHAGFYQRAFYLMPLRKCNLEKETFFLNRGIFKRGLLLKIYKAGFPLVICLYSWITQAFCGPGFPHIPGNLVKPSERKPLERSPSVFFFSTSFVLGLLFSKVLESRAQGMTRKGSGFRTSGGAGREVGLLALLSVVTFIVLV